MGISKNSAYPSLLEKGAGVEVMKARVFRDAHMFVYGLLLMPTFRYNKYSSLYYQGFTKMGQQIGNRSE